MIKNYMKTFYKAFFFTTVLTFILNIFIVRRFDTTLPYIGVTLSVFLISIFIALAIRVFKSEKGNGYINAVLGYILIIPAIFVIRNTYGTYLFRFTYTIYFIIAGIGIIYGIALLVASRKYKTEVDELNRLLLDKEESSNDLED